MRQGVMAAAEKASSAAHCQADGCGGELDSSMVCRACGAIHFQPHPGPQTDYQLSMARITFMGGARGGGKSRGSIYRPMGWRPKLPADADNPGPREYHRPIFDDPRFVGMVFRREKERLRKKGGMWDEAQDVYPAVGGRANQNEMSITFPSGAAIQMAGIEHEKDTEKYRGLAFSWILLEEGTEYTQKMFDALLRCLRPRARSDTEPWMDITCNPDPDSWILKYIIRFLDEKGYPDKEKCKGTLYCLAKRTEDDQVIWVDQLFDADPELAERFDNDPSKYVDENGAPPLSIRYIPSTVDDNPTIYARDKGYITNLHAQEGHLVERDRRGCWFARASDTRFSKARFHYVDLGILEPWIWEKVRARAIRYWDQAATRRKSTSSQAATAGVLTSVCLCPVCEGWRFDDDGEPCWLCNTTRNADGESVPIVGPSMIPLKEEELEKTFWILDVATIYGSPGEVEVFTQAVARRDGYSVPVYIEEEVGSSGKNNIHNYRERVLKGYEVHGDRPTGSKDDRSSGWCGAAERGLVFVVQALWTPEFEQAKNLFPATKGRDIIDGTSGGFHAGQAHEWTTRRGDWSAAVT